MWTTSMAWNMDWETADISSDLSTLVPLYRYLMGSGDDIRLILLLLLYLTKNPPPINRIVGLL